MHNETQKTFSYLWLKFKSGVSVSITIVFIYLIVKFVIQNVLAPTSFISQNILVQLIIAVALIIIFGIIVDKLKKKRSWLLSFLPTSVLERKEVRFWDGDKYIKGILTGFRMNTRNGEEIKLGEISLANGGPTSVGLIPMYEVPENELEYTGRTFKDAIIETITLGAAGKKKNSILPE